MRITRRGRVGTDVGRLIVVERKEAGASDQGEDVAVVAKNHVGVEGMLGDNVRDRVAAFAEFVAIDARSCAAENDVIAVRTLRRRGQPEQVRTAADEVVLAETAEQDIIVAAAFDVIVSVGRIALE